MSSASHRELYSESSRSSYERAGPTSANGMARLQPSSLTGISTRSALDLCQSTPDESSALVCPRSQFRMLTPTKAKLSTSTYEVSERLSCGLAGSTNRPEEVILAAETAATIMISWNTPLSRRAPAMPTARSVDAWSRA